LKAEIVDGDALPEGAAPREGHRGRRRSGLAGMTGCRAASCRRVGPTPSFRRGGAHATERATSGHSESGGNAPVDFAIERFPRIQDVGLDRDPETKCASRVSRLYCEVVVTASSPDLRNPRGGLDQ